MTGKTLAHYDILEKVGEGGMGEVYRASDSRLGREVAIKLLPEAFAHDPERLSRFEREARVLASLNHPNIAAIYGFEQCDGVPFLAMEFVAGENIAGPVPLEDALNICCQTADALEAAHEKGIVHRDLKPANIRITPEGKVKVLDFGLAKAVAGDVAAEASTDSPTLTIAATQVGVLLGTAAYMSPEQVRGKNADKRADIWAFGCIVYELLTGRKAFDGDNVSDLLAAVLKEEPDWTALPDSTPSHIRHLMRWCLEKDPKRRLRDIGDAWPDLNNSPVQAAPVSARQRPAFWMAATGLAVALALALGVVHFSEKPRAAPTTRFELPPPRHATGIDYPTVSPDGRRVTFTATLDGRTLLWVRPLDSLAAQPLAGTADATSPFWSPDSRFIGFFAQGSLKRVDVSGGSVQTLCAADNPGRGATWNADGTILFGSSRGPLRRVAASGGAPTLVTTLDSTTEQSHRYPQFLPDGRHFLYLVHSGDQQKSAIVIGSLDDKPDAKARRRLMNNPSMAIYSAGHLLFERDGPVMAQRFDVSRLELQGDSFAVIQEAVETFGGRMRSSASPEGTLVYATRDVRTQLAWFDRAGRTLSQVGSPEQQSAPRLAPGQQKAVVFRRHERNDDIWLLDLLRGTSTRFTSHPLSDFYPVWSPDSDRIVFASGRIGPFNLYYKESSSSANEQLLLRSDEFKIPTDWSSDGRFILYQSRHAQRANDLWVLPLENGGSGRKAIAVLETDFDESWGQFSPDGNWIAYQSNESGKNQVYLMSFAVQGRKIPVSTDGGMHPRWRRDGRELYYLNFENKLMAVEMKGSGPGLELGRPYELFQTRAERIGVPAYDVSADGQRFLINTTTEADGPPPITVVMNWASIQR